MSEAGSRAGRATALALLSIGTLGFGTMSLCGGFWTAASIPALIAPGGAGAMMILAVSLPSLIGGFFMARSCLRKIRNVEARSADKDESA